MIDPLVDWSGAPTAYGKASRNCRGSAFTQSGGASTKVTTSAPAVWSTTSVVVGRSGPDVETGDRERIGGDRSVGPG